MQYKRIPFMSRRGFAGYSEMSPGGGFLGDYADDSVSLKDGKRTVILRPRPGAATGFQGFFAWLAATHPKLYNYAAVALPNEVDAESLGNPASQLAGMGLLDPLTSTVSDSSIASSADVSFSDVTLPTSVTNALPSDATASPPTSDSSAANIISTITQAASAILPVIQDQKILNLQLTRAAQGKPPLDTSKYFPNSGINLGLNPSTQNTVLILGGLVGGAFLLSKLLAGRRG